MKITKNKIIGALVFTNLVMLNATYNVDSPAAVEIDAEPQSKIEYIEKEVIRYVPTPNLTSIENSEVAVNFFHEPKDRIKIDIDVISGEEMYIINEEGRLWVTNYDAEEEEYLNSL